MLLAAQKAGRRHLGLRLSRPSLSPCPRGGLGAAAGRIHRELSTFSTASSILSSSMASTTTPTPLWNGSVQRRLWPRRGVVVVVVAGLFVVVVAVAVDGCCCC